METTDEIIEKIKEKADTVSSIQIRLFDDKTGRVFYKYLTYKEFLNIASILKVIKWEG